jgi:hypothetical protein
MAWIMDADTRKNLQQISTNFEAGAWGKASRVPGPPSVLSRVKLVAPKQQQFLHQSAPISTLPLDCPTIIPTAKMFRRQPQFLLRDVYIAAIPFSLLFLLFQFSFLSTLEFKLPIDLDFEV